MCCHFVNYLQSTDLLMQMVIRSCDCMEAKHNCGTDAIHCYAYSEEIIVQLQSSNYIIIYIMNVRMLAWIQKYPCFVECKVHTEFEGCMLAVSW